MTGWAESDERRPDRFPWPPPTGTPVLEALGATWRGAALDPAAFYVGLPRDGGTRAALLYYLIIGTLVAGASLFWDSLGGLGAGMARERIGYDPSAGLGPLTAFLLSPLILLIALAATALVVHALLRMLGDGDHGLDTTIRVLCYAYSPMILGVVPVLGALVGGTWMLVLAVIGLREAQETDGWRAWLAVFLPLVLIAVLTVVVALAILSTGVGILTG